MEIKAKITKTLNAPEDVTIDTAMVYLNKCAQKIMEYTKIDKTFNSITISLTGGINAINEFRNEFIKYNCAAYFKWEDDN